MFITTKKVLVSLMVLWCVLPHCRDALAMDIGQLRALAGTALLDLRVDATLRKCGLPSTLFDTAIQGREKREVRWGGVAMQLSAADWDLMYGSRPPVTPAQAAWVNPRPEPSRCLADLSRLIVHAQGNVGILSVTKRADRQGYVTSYRLPQNLYRAHQVIGVTGDWKRGLPLARLRVRYGEPDEIIARAPGGTKLYRYWVVEKNHRQMPVSLHAVEFEIDEVAPVCTRYAVQSSGFEFVRQKLDALLRQWEKDYVLD